MYLLRHLLEFKELDMLIFIDVHCCGNMMARLKITYFDIYLYQHNNIVKIVTVLRIQVKCN